MKINVVIHRATWGMVCLSASQDLLCGKISHVRFFYALTREVRVYQDHRYNIMIKFGRTFRSEKIFHFARQVRVCEKVQTVAVGVLRDRYIVRFFPTYQNNRES